MKWWKEFHVYNDLVKYYIIVKTLWLVHKKNQCLVLVNDKSVDTLVLCSAHLKPSNIATDDVGVSFVEIVEEKRQVRWVILTLTYLLLRRAISGKGVRTLSGSTCLNGVDLPNEFIFLSNEIFKRFNC